LIILDTNLVSEGMKPSPDPRAMRWLTVSDPFRRAGIDAAWRTGSSTS